MNLLDSEYRLAMVADRGERCHQEVQLVTLRSRNLSSLRSLEGGRVAFTDHRPSVVFLSKSFGTFKERLVSTDPRKLVGSLESWRVDALLTLVERYPERDVSEEFGDQSRAQNFANFRVSHVTELKVPCWGIAIRRGVDDAPLQKLIQLRRARPEIGRRLLRTIANAEDLTGVNYFDWVFIREKLGRGIYRDYKYGGMKLGVKPL